MGDVLNGRYSVIEIISEDRLYKAMDTATGSFVAVKKWKSKDQSFNNELSALMSVTHPAIPRFADCFYIDGYSYIAEEWIEGDTLASAAVFPVITDFALSCAEFLCSLTADKNSMRVHGDIKPSNIIVKDGKAFFIDFESSVKIEKKRGGRENTGKAQNNRADTLRLASEYFTAPEVFFGKLTPQSDIYSVGMVLAWMLGGFDDDGPDTDRISDLCVLKPIIRKCTAPDAKNRFPDAQALLKTLKKVCGGNENIKNVKDIHSGPYESARRFSLYIDCNVCFGWELACSAALFFGMKTCIMALTERTQRKLKYYAENDRYYDEEYAEEEAVPYMLNYRSLYQRNAEAWHANGLIHRTDVCDNLYYSGTRLIDELEPENEVCISDIVNWGRANFDCMIFITDRYDDKPAVKNLTSSCDYTIATPLANVDDIEACRNYYERFGGHVLYAAWEYNEKSSLPEESIALIVGADRYLGCVSHNDNRTAKRNYIGKMLPIFGSGLYSEEENTQYINIINRLFHNAYGTAEYAEGVTV